MPISKLKKSNYLFNELKANTIQIKPNKLYLIQLKLTYIIRLKNQILELN